MTETKRVWNFSPGPAALPLPVLERVQRELVCLPRAGASILELSHRGGPFLEILAGCQANLRKLLAIPDNYKVLFLQGGARLQFSMIPMNFLRGADVPADYLVTGSWSKKALAEAAKEGPVRVAWDGQTTGYDRLPEAGELKLNDKAPYVYLCSNETIQGVQFQQEPATGGAPLVSDNSSDLLCRPVPVEKYGLIYACAQKNLGPAGVTIVIVREDLLDRSSEDLPGYLNYREHVAENSLYNTPPTFAVYVVKLVTDWLLEEVGGLAAMEALNQKKAALLYEAIDGSEGFYRGHAQRECRSLMNVTFRLASEELEKKFVAEAAARDLASLKGHRSVGGIRASVYNAMPVEGVQALRDFMIEFRQNHA